MVQCGMVWYGTVWYGMVCHKCCWFQRRICPLTDCHVVCCMIWYGVVWYGMVLYSVVQYGMVCYGVSQVLLVKVPKKTLSTRRLASSITPLSLTRQWKKRKGELEYKLKVRTLQISRAKDVHSKSQPFLIGRNFEKIQKVDQSWNERWQVIGTQAMHNCLKCPLF